MINYILNKKYGVTDKIPLAREDKIETLQLLMELRKTLSCIGCHVVYQQICFKAKRKGRCKKINIFYKQNNTIQI